MWQVLFEVPHLGLKIYGFGLMLFLALVVSTKVAIMFARREGADAQLINDLSLWMFSLGIVGARALYMWEYWDEFDHPLLQFFAVWEGGLVVYGSAAGALLGLLIFCRRRKLRPLWLLDIVAPAIAVGVGMGRMGCFLNGCCYGDVCQQPWSVTFPPGSPAHAKLVRGGFQSRLGFVAAPADRRVLFVEPGSFAERSGLRTGDRIVAINGTPIEHSDDLRQRLMTAGAADQAEQSRVLDNPARAMALRRSYTLSVETPQPNGTFSAPRVLQLAPSRSLPLHPTQLYSVLDGFIIFALLASYFPFRQREGEVVGLLGMTYSISRFLIESLRFDEPAIALGMTLSQNISLIMFIGGATLFVRRFFARPKERLDEPMRAGDGSGPMKTAS